MRRLFYEKTAMNIAVVGTGYVGLVTGACLADRGHCVICIDSNEKIIEGLIRGTVPIHEPGLEDVVLRTTASDGLTFCISIREGISDAEVIFLCVGTPPKNDGSADLSHVFGAAEEIGRVLDHDAVVVSKSTVPVGTSHRIKSIIAKTYKGAFDVASNPEFLREGNAVSDFFRPDRLVIGTDGKRAQETMALLYEVFDCEKVFTDIESAEMIKYASNAFLATKISFINEMAQVCEAVGADVEDVARGMGLDSRIGPKFLRAGLGYGGSCFPKDVRALYQTAGLNGYQFQLLRSVIEVNNTIRWTFYQKIKSVLGGFQGKRIAVWGMAFKPDTDDIRESIALEYIERMQDEGAQVVAYDPVAGARVAKARPKIMLAHSALEAAKDADAVVLVTEWDEFERVDLKALSKMMHTPVLFDGRNVFDVESMRAAGFVYHSIGRVPVASSSASILAPLVGIEIASLRSQ